MQKIKGINVTYMVVYAFVVGIERQQMQSVQRFHKEKSSGTRQAEAQPDTGTFSILRYTIPHNLIITDRMLPDAAAVIGIAFDGIDGSVLHLPDNSGMIGASVLRTGFTVRTVPVIEDNHAWLGCDRPVCPATVILEPLNTLNASSVFGDNTVIDIPAFVCTGVAGKVSLAHGRGVVDDHARVMQESLDDIHGVLRRIKVFFRRCYCPLTCKVFVLYNVQFFPSFLLSFSALFLGSSIFLIG